MTKPVLPALLAVCAALSALAARCGGDAAAAKAAEFAAAFTPSAVALHADLAELTRAPHPLGSPRQAELTAWLGRELNARGVTPKQETFTAIVPNSAATHAVGPVATTLSLAGTNVWGFGAVRPDAPCVVALASHYDTKIVEGAAYVGANDSGSSTAVLLEQMTFLKMALQKNALRCDIAAVFLDGEEAVLPNWTDGQDFHPARQQDNTYGSRYGAARLTSCEFDGKPARCLPPDLGGKPLVAVILMDMIGSPDLLLTRDLASTQKLVDLAVNGARSLGYPEAFDPRPRGMEDDHIPFLKSGVSAVDLIDFNHLAWWHRAGDEPGTLSDASMQTGGRIALFTAVAVAVDPAAYLSNH